jgi:hypothetical protein
MCRTNEGIFQKQKAGKLSFFGFLCRMNGKEDLQVRWWELEAKLVERFGKKPDVEAILFLIGLQETNVPQPEQKISKEQKQDLMHVAVCRLLSQSGYYEFDFVDTEGWPHYKQLKQLPDLNAFEQENFLKDHILLYFEQAGI